MAHWHDSQRTGSSSIAESRMERAMLLGDEEERADDQGGISLRRTKSEARARSSLASLPVYSTIHRIRRAVTARVNDPYSLEQLNAPEIATSMVQPLVEEFYNATDMSIVYCLLINRVQYLREKSDHAYHQNVNTARALLCELLASKVMQKTDEDNLGPDGLLLLANILVTAVNPFQRMPDSIVQQNRDTLHRVVKSEQVDESEFMALELAIMSESKNFLSSAACQKVVDAIHKGRVVYTPSSPIDIIPDRYKYRPTSLYDPRKASLLNQYRLIVPRTRNILEIGHFIILMVLYFLVMSDRQALEFTSLEQAFCVYSFGWMLDQFASILEHGWRIYTRNLWAFLDVTFAVIYFIYLVIRLRGVLTGDAELAQEAMDVLSTAAAVLVPRLAFCAMSENMLFVSLRAMMADFALLSLLAVWCSAGFLLSMVWLSNGVHPPTTISKWMLWVWFGLDGTGIERSVDFHWLLGPILMIAFAFLGNTLFLTILVAMLSNTFSSIVGNATAENQYQRAVLTFGGVKSDAIFAFQPPFNILAICLMLPLRFVLSPRWFHKFNVAAARVLNAPLLLAICTYERRFLRNELDLSYDSRKKRGKFAAWAFSRFSVYGDVQAVFDNEPFLPSPDTENTNFRVVDGGLSSDNVLQTDPTDSLPSNRKAWKTSPDLADPLQSEALSSATI